MLAEKGERPCPAEDLGSWLENGAAKPVPRYSPGVRHQLEEVYEVTKRDMVGCRRKAAVSLKTEGKPWPVQNRRDRIQYAGILHTESGSFFRWGDTSLTNQKGDFQPGSAACGIPWQGNSLKGDTPCMAQCEKRDGVTADKAAGGVVENNAAETAEFAVFRLKNTG